MILSIFLLQIFFSFSFPPYSQNIYEGKILFSLSSSIPFPFSFLFPPSSFVCSFFKLQSISSNVAIWLSSPLVESQTENMRSNSSFSYSSFVLNTTVAFHPLKKLISLPLFNISFPLSLSLSLSLSPLHPHSEKVREE
jgi:hypothetical protein